MLSFCVHCTFSKSSIVLTSELENVPAGLLLSNSDLLVFHQMPLPMDNSTLVHLVTLMLACWWMFLVVNLDKVSIATVVLVKMTT